MLERELRRVNVNDGGLLLPSELMNCNATPTPPGIPLTRPVRVGVMVVGRYGDDDHGEHARKAAIGHWRHVVSPLRAGGAAVADVLLHDCPAQRPV